MTNSLLVILNPKSGSSGEDFRAAIEAELQQHGAHFEIRETTLQAGADVLTQNAVREGARHLLICGGDGTVMSAVNGLGHMETAHPAAEPETRFSIIPGGTANLLATALGIPPDVEKAVAIALDGRDKVIDLGYCEAHLFALGLGLGLTERLVSQASAREKEKLGRWAYLKAMMAELGARPSNFSFRLDDGPMQFSQGVAVVIANSGDIGGKLKFAPDALMDDGRLDLCVLHRFYLRDVIRIIGRSFLGSVPADRAVSFFQAGKIEVKSDPPLDLQIDGEVVAMQTPLVAEVRPRALRVRVPTEEQKEAQKAGALVVEPLVEAAAAVTEAVGDTVQGTRKWPWLIVAALLLITSPLLLWRKRRAK